jgi:hypothetical protein
MRADADGAGTGSFDSRLDRPEPRPRGTNHVGRFIRGHERKAPNLMAHVTKQRSKERGGSSGKSPFLPPIKGTEVLGPATKWESSLEENEEGEKAHLTYFTFLD